MLRCALSLLFAIWLASHVFADDKEWDNGGATEFWDDDDNWDPDEKPQPSDKAIVAGNPEVNTLEIFGDLENSGTIDITAGTLQPQGEVTNTGTINIGDGSAIRSQLIIDNDIVLSGGGEVILRNSDNLPASNAVLRGGFNTASVNDVGHTIRGEGSIIQNWQNDGTIIAEETSGDSSAVLRLDNTTFLNNGELRSTSGATIVLSGADYSQGAGGQLTADTDNITFTGATFVTGGSLETIGGGKFIGNGLVTLSSVTVNAPIDNTNTSGDGRLYVDSALTNNSTITLDVQGGTNSQFGFTTSGTLDGTGEIVLVGGNTNTFIGVFPGIPREFTQGASHTIRGAGGIGSPIINNGTIRAEPGTDGSVLRINTPQTNNGLMEAGAGATLEFQSSVSNTLQSVTGVISAATGGAVEFENTVITGGRFETTGTGTMTVTFSPLTVNNVINAGNLDVPSSRTLRVDGGLLTNDGTITINSNGGAGVPRFMALQDTLLDGAGEVVLDGTNNNSRSDIVPNGFIITHDTDHTVRGNGQIIGIGTFVNSGRVEGNSAAEPMRIRTRLEGTGTLKDVSLDFDSSRTVHAPGDSVGTVPLEGSYAITHNLVSLEIELGGTTPGGAHDQLTSTGTVALNGILDVALIDLDNGYTPSAGDQFDIITSSINGISGTFATETFPQFALGHELTWLAVDYQPGVVTLEIDTATPYDVDLDNDGDVDGADFLLIQQTDPSLIPAWRFEYGSGVGAMAAQVAVPEPSTLLLLSIALLSFCRIREAYSQPNQTRNSWYEPYTFMC